MTLNGLINHIGLWRRTEHLAYCQIERTDTISLLESKAMVACGFTHHIHWSALTLGNLADMFQCFFLDEQAHALLALVGDNFLRRKGFITNRQLTHIYQTTTIFHQFAEAVNMTCCSVIVDRYNRIVVFLAEGTNHIVGSFLHLGIGALNSIQLYTIAITACIY